MEIIDNPAGADTSPPSAASKRRVSLSEQINLNVFWLANNFHWQALLAIIRSCLRPYRLQSLPGDFQIATGVRGWSTFLAQ